ncbi:MAG: division/cell wall cluster transcriptional repressor MraZ [Chitinophagales bacterium]
MSGFLGEHICKLDSKGRLKVPSALKKQFAPEINGRFVINRGFEQCLTLYPFDEWQRISARVNKLNTFEKKKREFKRYFYRGATELVLDSSDRLLLPKHLMDYAGIEKEMILTSQNNMIEVWNPKRYEDLMAIDSDEFADLAEEVMGDLDENSDD